MVTTAESAHAVVELLAYIESRFAVGPERHGYLSATDEPYIVLSGGFGPLPQILESAKSQFDAYASERKGVLYWRVRPEFEENKMGWRFYMRLLISDKSPETQKVAANG